MADVDEAIAYVQRSIEYARVAEALVAAITVLTPVVELVGRLAEIDEEMVPEVAAAISHLSEAGEALGRAHTFAATRLQVTYENRSSGNAEA